MTDQPMRAEPDPLPLWLEALDRRLEELRKQRKSGRLHLYLDLRCGEVIEGGEERAAEPWTENP